MADRKKIVLALVLLLIAAASIWGYFYSRGDGKRDRITATGVVEATEVELGSEISGRIEWLCCKEGDSVYAGDPVVRIESQESKARVDEARAALLGASEALNEARVALENAETQREAARYELEAARAEVDRVKALTDEAEANLERARGLLSEGFMSRKDYDAAQADYNAYHAQLGAAEARMRSAGANLMNSSINIKAARAKIASAEAKRKQGAAQVRVLEAELDETVINTPISGVVVYKAFETGEMVSPGQPVFTIDDLKNIWVRVDVEETDVQEIKLGGRVEAHLPFDGERAFTGKVIEIGAVGGFATQRDVTRGRSDIKTFRVKAAIDNPEGVLKPGMTVELNLFFNNQAQGK